MRVKNKKIKLLIIILILLLCPFFCKINDTFGIYKSHLTTTINLTVLNPSNNYEVTLHLNDGNGTTSTIYKSYNEQMGNDLTTPTRTNYNFLGWYDSNDRKIDSNERITSNIDFYAHWAKIVCKKVTNSNNLNTETCAGSDGCRTGGVGYSQNASITYGSIFGANSPTAGDAYDCDVYYSSNTDNYDEIDQYGKHIERFYFVREKENQNSENTAVLIYYTSFDSNGRVDTQHTNKDNIGSAYYNTALTWLPTSSTWANPGLIDFDSNNNGKISRFLSIDDLEAVCGTIPDNSSATTAYFTSCFSNSHNWFMFENSRFQSSNLGRAGIWFETDGVKYYRYHTSSISISTFNDGTESENMARPVIEIPMSALDGYVNAERYTIDFNVHDGTSVTGTYRRYDGQEIGILPTTTREHYTFDGWYATYENGTYSDPVTTSTVVHNDMTLHAKWTAKPTCTVTLNLNGGTGLTSPVIVDIGDLYNPGTPTKENSSFLGWYTDAELNTQYNATVPISTSTLILYAKWATSTYVAAVEGVGSFETLASAIQNVPTGSVKTRVTLLQNVTLTSTVTIPNTKWVEFDTGNYTLSGAVTLFGNNGKLDIIGGSLSGSATNLINNGNNATLNIIGGTLTNTSSASSNVIEVGGGTVNITGGNIICNAQGAAVNNRSGGLVNVSGGIIKGTNTTKGQAIYMEDANSRTNISGDAYIENKSQTGNDKRAAVDNTGGTLVITGGTIVSTQYNAVNNRGANAITTIGDDDNIINITTPVIRGIVYGLERSNGTVNIYDGIFESLNNTRAINGTVTKPNGIDFTDSTVDVSGVTYHSTYLLVPIITIRFDANGGTIEGESYKEIQISNGNTIGANMPNDPIKSNYYFDGWYDGNTQITSNTMITSGFVAYAKWVQSISNATISSTMNVIKDTSSNIEIPENDIEQLTYSSSDTNVATVDTNGQVTGVNIGTATITITGAKSGSTRTVTVTVIPLTHTVTFKDSDNTTVLYTREVVDGNSLGENMPANPTRTNYVLNAWYINGSSVAPFNASTTVTGNITVIANWKEKITYATLSKSPNPFEIIIGNTGQIDLTPTDQNGVVEGYTFTSGNSNIATVDANGEVTGVAIGSTNITITGSLSGAILTVPVSVDVLKHTVTFKDGDDVLTSIRVVDGTRIGELMPNNPTKTNYLFNAWYINGNSLYPVTNETIVENDIIAVASWTPTIQLATVPATLTVGLGYTSAINITGPTGMESYTFTSNNSSIASVDANGVVTGVAYGTTSIVITGSRSNTTRTIEITIGNDTMRTITFKDFDNTTILYTKEVVDGTSLGENMPANPTKQNYIFNGWYINGNSLTPFNASTSVSGGDIIVIASWKATISAASINTNPDPLRIKLGETGQITITNPIGTLVENYTFSSSNTNIAYSNANGIVYTEDVGTVTITITGTESRQTQTLQVVVHNKRTITFDPDNGDEETTIEVDYGTSIDDANVTLPTNPTKTGYTFDRWYYYDGNDLTTTSLDTTKIITQNETYKARWASDSNIAAIGTRYFDTLSAAIDAVPTGTSQATEIRIIKNVSLTSSDSRPTVPYNKSVILNGGNYTVECYQDNVIWNKGITRVVSGTFICGYSGKGPIENDSTGTLYIDGGIIRNTNDRGAVYNRGHVIMSGGELYSAAQQRSTINNVQSGASIEISGGTITQANTSCNKGAVENYSGGTITITGGTITSASTSNNVGGVQNVNNGTLIIGTQNGDHNATNPLIRGKKYGVYSPVAFTFYDGLLEGITAATNQSTLTVESGAVPVNNETETIGSDTYKKLYYVIQQTKYRIIFEANDGEVSPSYKDFALNTEITSNNLPTPTRTLHTFDGWYTNEELTTPFTAFAPSTVDTVHYYAKWNFNSSTTAVPFRITSDAMNNYFSSVNTWITADLTDTSNNNSEFENRHSLYKDSINNSLTTYGCSVCNGPNTCTSPSTGTYCEQSRGYETGLTEDLDVYLYVNNAKGDPVTYTTSEDGVIYNMIPGVTYYWESHNDSTKYGVVTATGQRRTIKSSVRNVRDLGGLAADTNNDGTPDGTIKYGKLYRGAQINTSEGVDSLIKLGITREIDLRETGDNGAGTQPHFGDTSHQTNQNNVNLKYDIDINDNDFDGNSIAASNGNIGYKDIVIRNYLINPTTVTGYYNTAHLDNYREFKKVLKKTMQYAINGENIYFHCTIGTDRTGTLAYFLEGLLGVSLEDRIEDYELTYYYGLTNRHRFHNNLSGSSWNPRFYAMYMSYPTYDEIYDFYTYERESDDDTLLASFKNAMIE